MKLNSIQIKFLRRYRCEMSAAGDVDFETLWITTPNVHAKADESYECVMDLDHPAIHAALAALTAAIFTGQFT